MLNRTYAYLLIFFLSTIFVSSCATQGRLTYLEFQQSDDEAVLRESLERLKNKARDGYTNEQFSALRELRYLSKYSPNLMKQKLAVEGLLFLASFCDDRDVQEKSDSRLSTILSQPEAHIGLKLIILDGKREVILGKMTYQKVVDSELQTFPATTSDREDALLFVMDHFPSLEKKLQKSTIEVLQQVLANPPLLDPDDAEDQKDWQLELMERLKKWNTESKFDAEINVAIARLYNENSALVIPAEEQAVTNSSDNEKATQ